MPFRFHVTLKVVSWWRKSIKFLLTGKRCCSQGHCASEAKAETESRVSEAESFAFEAETEAEATVSEAEAEPIMYTLDKNTNTTLHEGDG